MTHPQPSMTEISVSVFLNSDKGVLLTRSSPDQHWTLPTKVVQAGDSIIGTANQLLNALHLDVEIYGVLTMEWWSQHPDRSCSELWLIYSCDWLDQDEVDGLTTASELRFTRGDDLPRLTTPRLNQILVSSASDHLSRPPVFYEDGRAVHPTWMSGIGPDFGRDE